jgi:hypothetical protein
MFDDAYLRRRRNQLIGIALLYFIVIGGLIVSGFHLK